MAINEAKGPRPKRPRGIKIWPNKMRHCLCCRYANWFRTNPDDEDSIEDMTVRCRFFPNEDKMVGTGTNCQHFKGTFCALKTILPHLVSF